MKVPVAWLGVTMSMVVPMFAMAAPTAACRAHGQAAFEAWVHGHYDQARSGFSPTFAGELTSAKLEQVRGQLQSGFGAFQKLGTFEPRTLKDDAVMAAPIDFARGQLAAVFACDTKDRVAAFLLLNPAMFPTLLAKSPVSAGQAMAPIPARIETDGVRVEPLSVSSQLGPLRGALTVPAGQGPFPAVVLVQGSGAHDLDETVGPNQPFRDIAEGLAKAGIASLRYDKRTFDYGLKVAANPGFTVDDEVTDDALTALHLLAKQKSIDPHRLFVLGHSLGAMMAPRIAKRDPQLAGVVMLAAPARPFLAVVAAQIRELGPQEGESAGAIAKREKAIAAEQKLLADANPAHPPQGTFELLPGHAVQQAYLLSLHDYQQVATAKSLALPILILQGGNDFQVSPEFDFGAWKKALAGKSNVTFRQYPALSHLFMPGPTSSPADYDKPAHVDPNVIDDIADWIRAQPPLK